jgi:hypothetical protein
MTTDYQAISRHVGLERVSDVAGDEWLAPFETAWVIIAALCIALVIQTDRARRRELELRAQLRLNAYWDDPQAPDLGLNKPAK